MRPERKSEDCQRLSDRRRWRRCKIWLRNCVQRSRCLSVSGWTCIRRRSESSPRIPTVVHSSLHPAPPAPAPASTSPLEAAILQTHVAPLCITRASPPNPHHHLREIPVASTNVLSSWVPPTRYSWLKMVGKPGALYLGWEAKVSVSAPEKNHRD